MTKITSLTWCGLSLSLWISKETLVNHGQRKMTFTNLPSGDDTTLEVGALFEVDGVLKISKVNIPHCTGNSATSGLGSVTVSIS